MRIIHIADLHFRSLSRHEEYREIFIRFFNDIQQHKPNLLVIAGDIVDEKLLITAELVDILCWFFTECNNLHIPVIVIPGNHDLNLKNLNRLDILSPIIDNLLLTNIIYCKESKVLSDLFSINIPPGFNKLNDFSFHCYSPFDEEKWKTLEIDENKVNICIFHGCVGGAKNDDDYVLGAEYSISLFDKFDFVLLGDIHRAQKLNKEGTIAYCGSTIQQNFGETVDKHGYLLWDIEGKKEFSSILVELENKKPFVELCWKDDLQQLLSEVKKYPKGFRVKVRSETRLPPDIKDLVEKELKKTCDLVVFDSKRQYEIDLSIEESTTKKNIRNVSVLSEMCRKISPEIDVELLEHTLTKHISVLPQEEKIGIVWTPLELRFSNFMQFGKDNVVNFESFTGNVVGILAPNGYGKSTILGVLNYAISGKLDREIKQNQSAQLIHHDCKKAEVEFYLNINGFKHRIYRSIEKINRKGKISIKQGLEFSKFDDGVEISLNGEKPADTEKIIREYLGLIDDFRITSISPQTKLTSFITDYKSTERKQKLYKFRDLQILSDLFLMCKDDLKKTQAIVDTIDVIDWDGAIKNNLLTIKNCNDILNILEQEEIENNNRITELNTIITENNSGKKYTEFDLVEKQNQIDKIKSEIETLETQISYIKDQKDKLLNKLEKIRAKIAIIDINDIRNRIEKQNKLATKISVLKQKLQNEINILEQKEKTVSKLQLVPCGDQFPTCRYIQDAHLEKKNIEPQKDVILELSDKISEIDALLIDDREYKKQVEKYDDFNKKEIELLKKINSVSIDSYISKCSLYKEKLGRLEEEYINIKSNLIDEGEKILADEIIQLKTYIREQNKKKIEIAGEIGILKQQNEQFIKDKEKYKSIEKKLRVYENMVFAFGKKGIPNQIIRTELPSLNKLIKDSISNIVDFDIELVLEEDSDQLDIDLIHKNGIRSSIELCGQMQQSIAALAIRLAFIQSSSLPKTDFLALDECFDGIDDNQFDYVLKMLLSLKKSFKFVLLITHKKEIKEHLDMIIEIGKQGKFSYIGGM